MVKIYKEKLGIEGNIVTIKGRIRKILTVQLQNGWPHVWYEVDDNSEEKEVSIVSYGTGWEMTDKITGWDYIGTVQDVDGYIWHYYSTPIYENWFYKIINGEGLWKFQDKV